MPCKPSEHYPSPPDKRKTPRISPEFIKRKQTLRRSTIVNEAIRSYINLVSRSNIERLINQLTSFHNRHSKSENINLAAEWIVEELKNITANNSRENNNPTTSNSISYHEYSEDQYHLKNVVYHRQGSSDKIILFCAHYDTILQSNINDIESRAPGADDNASGVCALLEMARIISTLDLEYSIRFVFFSGEEQGYWGSKHYAEYVKVNNEDLYAVVNLDMCSEPGFLTTKNTTNIDIDDGTTGSVSTNNEASQLLGQKMEKMAIDYTNLKVEYDPIAFSDYMPFEARGYVCIGAYDGSAIEHNHHYHSETDVPSNLDLDFLTSITKMTLAFALSEGRLVETTNA
jgi:Zn-dependent M28 family amino/carboxypeptidase